MKSDLPKVLHELCGVPMVELVARAMRGAGVEDLAIVVGFGGEKVQSRLGGQYAYVWQHEQHGSGHAVQMAMEWLEGRTGSVIISAGDTPLLGVETFEQLVLAHTTSGARCTVASSIMEDPSGYGRIVRDESGAVIKIVEHKDCTPHQIAIHEINVALYCVEAEDLRRHLPNLKNDNVQKEYYFTDVIEMIASEGGQVFGEIFSDPAVTVGINDRWQLAQADAELRSRVLKRHALNGVTLRNLNSIAIGMDVEIGPETIIEPGTILLGNTKIGSHTVIGPNSVLQDAVVGDHCNIRMSQIVEATIGNHVYVGPFANIRPKTVISDKAKVGNFVELKNTLLGPGAKTPHLSYIGDAVVGPNSNIGAGTITCNYDGFSKHRTVIGANAFVGSNSTLVAPLTIGDEAMTAAGSVITKDVSAGSMAFGRARQETKEGLATEWRKVKIAEKQ